MRSANRTLALFGLLVGAFSVPSHGQSLRPSLQDSFRIGTGGGALCKAQSLAADPAIDGMFDRVWSIACRDSAQPIGKLYALRGSDEAVADRVARSRGAALDCSEAGGVALQGAAGNATATNCRLSEGGVGYRLMRLTKDDTIYVAQGYEGYGDALELGLASIVADRLVAGDVGIASLGGTDAAAFARVQAAALDPQTTLEEGYRRNNSGNYAEAAEFFDTLSDDQNGGGNGETLSPAELANRQHEFVVNQALQQSNLGAFKQADRLFAEAAAIPTSDKIQSRLQRNFAAIHQLNQGDRSAAIAILDRLLATDASVAAPVNGGDGSVALGPQVAAEINSGVPTNRMIGVQSSARLTPDERAAILDAQALQLRGTALRLSANPLEARASLEQATTQALAIRDGRVVSITRLRAQLLAETALTYEATGDSGRAEALLNEAVVLLATQYPETVALNGARARLASFLVRQNRRDEAIALYRTIIASTTDNRQSLTGLANQIGPYFAVLTDEIPNRPELTADLFTAAQTLVRPGAADTLEVLARELSAGDDEASRLFRQSLSLSRDIERARIQLAQLTLQPRPIPKRKLLVASQQRDMAALAARQAETLTALAAYPQYRAVSRQTLTLEELRAQLKPDEAYMKLADVGGAMYVVWIDGTTATGYKAAMSSPRSPPRSPICARASPPMKMAY